MRPGNVRDLIDCINSYQGERNIIVPSSPHTLTIDEKIPIVTTNFSIENRPQQSAEIVLGSSGYFSIENSANLDQGEFLFKGMFINGNSVATRGISTENMGAGKRVRFLKIFNSRFYKFDANNAVSIKGKNPELWEIAGNSFTYTKTAHIDLYEDDYFYGNVWIHHNFLYCFSGANAGIGMRINQITSGKSPGNIFSHHNQYYGGISSSPNSLAIQAVLTNDDMGSIVSDGDRFEGLRVFSPAITAGTLLHLKILNSPQILFNATFDVELIELVEACHGCQVMGNTFARGGGNAIIGVRDENTGTTQNVNQVILNIFQYFNDGGSGSLYLSKAIGATTLDLGNAFTP